MLSWRTKRSGPDLLLLLTLGQFLDLGVGRRVRRAGADPGQGGGGGLGTALRSDPGAGPGLEPKSGPGTL